MEEPGGYVCFYIGRNSHWHPLASLSTKLISSRSFWLFHGQKDVQAVSFLGNSNSSQVTSFPFKGANISYISPLKDPFQDGVPFPLGWDMLLPWTF